MTETLCPLCGVNLEFPGKAEPPALTLDRLSKHFSSDCSVTARVPGSR